MKERLERNVYMDPMCGCWIWLRAVTLSRRGALRPRLNIRVNGYHTTLYAHRVSFETYVRKLKPGEEAGHRCNTTLCINPHHLEAQTHTENMRQEGERRKATRRRTDRPWYETF